ncbi:TonB family protein [Acetobacter indonesiensis]|uniref:TonB family protein n=1 Tax=Acetobacter indonesiensis TaxID=104101 RepID=UPI0011782043|nr:TonB family protein [Acetobacter indonesiensis]
MTVKPRRTQHREERVPLAPPLYAADRLVSPEPASLPVHLSAPLGEHGLEDGSGKKEAQTTAADHRRFWTIAFMVALVAHVIVTLCLVATMQHHALLSAPGERAVQMVFETPHAEQAAPPPVEPPRSAQSVHPVPSLDAPLQDAGATVPDPVVPDVTEALPTDPLPQPVVPHRAAAPAAPRAKAHTIPTPAKAKAQQSNQPPATPTVQSQRPPSPAEPAAHSSVTAADAPAPSVAHKAQGAGVTTLTCTPPQTHYPPMARHLHEEGEAVVEIGLNATGAVTTTRLVQSTGYDDLDAQALTAARGLKCAAPAQGAMVGRIPVGFHIQ